MCLAIPGKLIEVYEQNGMKMGRVDYAGTIGLACLAYVPEVTVGEYVIVHAGFGLSVIDEEEAQKTYEIWQEMAEKAAEEGMDVFGHPLEPGDTESGSEGES